MKQIEDHLKTLMMCSLAGDGPATRELLTSICPYLRGYFRRRLRGDTADVEDLVQETLLAIHLKRETFDPGGSVSAWVFAIARHKLVDWYRRRNARMTVPLEEAGALSADGDYDDLGARQDVARLLLELPVKQAMAIHCMKLEGLSATETARRTGQSVSAVKVGVHRGLKALAGWLRGQPR